jgi:Uma2 family endonuclease
VVQPDLCVICDKAKLDDKGCIGAPDLIIEILSASNSKKEMRTKKELYEENEVKEYWIIDATHETLLQYNLLENGKFSPPFIFVNDESVQSSIFPSLNISLMELFESKEEE